MRTRKIPIFYLFTTILLLPKSSLRVMKELERQEGGRVREREEEREREGECVCLCGGVETERTEGWVFYICINKTNLFYYRRLTAILNSPPHSLSLSFSNIHTRNQHCRQLWVNSAWLCVSEKCVCGCMSAYERDSGVTIVWSNTI